MPFFFLRLFNIVNDKQTTDVLYMSNFSSQKRFVSIFNATIIVALIVQYTNF